MLVGGEEAERRAGPEGSIAGHRVGGGWGRAGFVLGDHAPFAAAAAARLPVAHQHRHHHAAQQAGRGAQLRSGCQVRRLRGPRCARALQLVAMVLEPDFDLRGREAQEARQLLPLRRGQVALLPEAPLQLQRLRLGEQHPPLLPLLGVRAGRRGLSGRPLRRVWAALVRGWGRKGDRAR